MFGSESAPGGALLSTEKNLGINALSSAANVSDAVDMGFFQISAGTLVAQAEVAERNGNARLGANFRRAAEMTGLSDEEILKIYESLRPGRSSSEDLHRLSEELRNRGLMLCADFVAEAASVYEVCKFG